MLTMPATHQNIHYRNETPSIVLKENEEIMRLHETPGLITLDRVTAFKVLDTIHDESSEEWDGDAPVETLHAAIMHTKKLLRFLPYHVCDPDISTESDGDIYLEWYESVERLFSLSITQDGKVLYCYTGPHSPTVSGRFDQIDQVAVNFIANQLVKLSLI